jgi:hypothetical protein
MLSRLEEHAGEMAEARTTLADEKAALEQTSTRFAAKKVKWEAEFDRCAN